MATQEQDQVCEKLVRKITTGERLDDAEKSHLAACDACMAEIVRMLDESAARQPHGLDRDTAGSNGAPPPRPDANKALEQGRRVFQREFGISLSREE